jgi:DNA modification methylase
MHGQTKRDAAICRPGLADYVLYFRKPGKNSNPVNYEKNGIPFELWCKLAEPIWMDIEESNVLKGWQAGRGAKDERHITPTQLKPIHNSLLIFTNPGDTVFSPFSGIGSEGTQAIEMNRKFIGIELKESYFNESIKNLNSACAKSLQKTLF